MGFFNKKRETSLVVDREDPWYKKAYKWARKIAFTTSAEIWVGLTIGLVLAGGLSGRYYASKAGEIPLAFSEIEQITSDFNKASAPVPALTRFYAANNDITMKVFESNNIALAVNKSHTVFAHELQTRIDASLKKHALISEYTETMPQDAANALKAVQPLENATQGLPAINDAFNRAWDYHRRDVTHTRYWTTEDCNSDGKCTTVQHSEEVYDYSWHTYTFHADQARRAMQLLNSFMENNPDLTVQERLYVASMTHGENQEAIRRSMARELKDHVPTAEEYQKFANTWAEGSNLLKYGPQAVAEYNALKNLAPAWQQALGTAHSEHYRTYSRSDSGPAEYQVAETAAARSAYANDAAHGVVDGIHFSQQKAPELTNMIRDYVDVVLNGKPGNADHLRSDIMKTARALYDQNYENGFDVHTFKWLNVILIGLLGAAAGAGVGVGADKLLNRNRREWYDDQLSKEAREELERKDAAQKALAAERAAQEKAEREAREAQLREATEDLKEILDPNAPVNDNTGAATASTAIANDDKPAATKWADKYRKAAP